MKINVVKRKAASNRELSHAVYDIPEVKDLRGLLYQIMLVELSARPELSSAGKIAYELSQEKVYKGTGMGYSGTGFFRWTVQGIFQWRGIYKSYGCIRCAGRK